VAATVAAVLCFGISAGVGEGHMFVYLHWLAELIEAHHR
jgi:hypothetical protein